MSTTHTQPFGPRIKTIDFGWGLAVLLMILVHTLWMYADRETQGHSLLGHVIHFIGKGTAAFLICMGISMTLSRHQSLFSDIKRGVMILALGYLMNALKFLIPISVFGTMPEAFIEAYGWQSPLDGAQLRYLVLTGDILQMAGCALLFIAFVRRFILNPYGVLALAVLIALISREVSGYRPDISGLNYIADLFFSANYHVYFPVVPWASFILYGMFLGMKLGKLDFDQQQLFTSQLKWGLLAIALGAGLCYYNIDYHFGNFFHLGPGGVIYLLGINLVLMWLIFHIVQRGYNNTLIKLLNYCSRRVTSLYIIQWTLVCWGMGIIGYQTLSATETLLMMPVMVALTLIVQWSKDQLMNAFKRRGQPASELATGQ